MSDKNKKPKSAWLYTQLQGTLNCQTIKLQPLPSGDSCQIYLVHSEQGRFIVKTADNCAADLLPCEAQALQTIQSTATIATPQVVACSAQMLVLQYLPGQPFDKDYWTMLAQQLAALHRVSSDQFGAAQDNYCGRTPQPNQRCDDGHQFFVEQRLRYQATMAQRNGYLSNKLTDAVEQICQRLPTIIPKQPAALIHGDLWSGNHLCSAGRPYLIDPCTHFGWAEAEIAMTTLFGGFTESFYEAYISANPLLPGWKQRLPVYNLYHLLNHLNLFGERYLDAVEAVIKRYR